VHIVEIGGTWVITNHSASSKLSANLGEGGLENCGLCARRLLAVSGAASNENQDQTSPEQSSAKRWRAGYCTGYPGARSEKPANDAVKKKLSPLIQALGGPMRTPSPYSPTLPLFTRCR